LSKRKTAGKPDKTRQDWVLAALAALADGGVDAVRVERLAKVLDVSKGSFYWHFADRADLLSAILDLWDRDFTRQLIENAAGLPTARQRLEALAREALDTTMMGVDVARAEAAVHAWAAQDAKAAERMRATEEVRVAHLKKELSTIGLPGPQAGAMAKVLYLALIGLYSARRYNPELADDTAYLKLVKLVLDQAGDRSRAEKTKRPSSSA
jgi:AcrR family transcriptional regulator